MGHRGSYAVRKDGRTRLYRSQWGGDYVVRSTFFGPEPALDYCESLEPVDYLLDDVWCEGAVLLDLDSNELVFYQQHTGYHPEVRKHLLPLMQYAWPGWELRWAIGGIVEIATLLGNDLEQVRCIEDGDAHEAIPNWDDPLEWVSSILTIQSRGVAIDYCLPFCALGPLMTGPDVIDVLRRRASSSWTLADLKDDWESGANIDVDHGDISIWFLTSMDQERIERLRRQWPGWTIVRHDEGLPGQLERSGRDPAIGQIGEEAAIREIICLLFEADSFDPGRFLEHLESAGEEIQYVNPGFLKADKPIGEAGRKRAIFDRAVAEYREYRAT